MDKPFDLSDKYWARLSPKDQALYHLIRPQPKAAYTVDVQFDNLEEYFAGQARDLAEMGGLLELEPDFQRGHVWSDDQRTAYAEAVIRGTAPTRILFNCPGWSSSNGATGDIQPHTFQCVDGLQRLTAIRKLISGEIAVFGGLTASDLAKSPFDPRRYRFQFCVYEFANRADLLQFYLDLNRGGTVHSDSELSRVQKLLSAAKHI